ncbi:MAG: pyridoxamine 5'-phosphate oxidase family protein [bacterium]|nr:pyridoxamine 5'-phosphate oxidase family protein [bacterium]
MNNEREKTKKLALQFLREHKTAVVATASRSGEPEAATLFYAIDGDLTFNFITDSKGRKFKNLRENPHAAIVVGIGPDVMTIQCGGHAEIIDYLKDTDRAEKVIRKVIDNSKLHGNPPALPVLMNPDVELGVFIVKPEWMVMLNLEYEKDPEGYKHEYSKVLP